MDRMDRDILEFLMTNGRATHEEIGRKLNLSRPAVHQRVKKLEQSGVLRGYRADVNWSALGLDLDALIFIKSNGPHFHEMVRQIRAISIPDMAIKRVSRVSGEWCLIVEVRTDRPQNINRLIDALWELEGVKETSTTFVLADYHSDGAVSTTKGGEAHEGK